MDCLPQDLPRGALIAPSAATVAPAVPRAAARQPLPGRLARYFLDDDDGLPYMLYLPSRVRAGQPILVSVHGISRNAGEHARLFAPLAEEAGVVLVAPVFARERFPGYQRLAPNARGERPVEVLERIVAEVARRTGADGRRVYLFGYSGGGQFVHRFVMARPARVAGYAVGAAGWYTFPDAERRFPHGLRRSPTLGLGGFDAEAFLRVPGWVLVGERDTRRDAALHASARVLRLQGGSRLERGQRWAQAMNAAAAAHGLARAVGFETLPRSPHSFRRSMRRGGMGRRVFELFFGDADAALRPLCRAA